VTVRPAARRLTMIGLFPHCGFLSETSRMLAIHEALRALGEPVCIATHGGPWESLLTRAGVAWTQIGPRMDGARCAQFIRSLPGIGPPDQSMYSDDEMLAYAQAEAEFMRRRGIRLAVTGFTLTTLLSTRLAAIPLAASHAGSFVPPVFEAGCLPVPSRYPHPIFRLLPRRLQQRIFNAGPPRSAMYCSGFNRAAKKLGVEGVPSFAALLLADLTLVTDLPEILGIDQRTLERWQPRPGGAYRAGTSLRYTGPLFAQLDVPIPERVESFVSAGGAFVYVALTSSPAALVRDVVAAVKAAGCRVLVAATVHDLGALADNTVMVEPLLPSHRLMPRAALAVVTGGQGSVQTAMASGVPMIGIPLQPEQDLNVHCAERRGMAMRIAPDRARGPAMTQAVRAMLDAPGYRTQAQRLRAQFAQVDGAHNAALAIRRYLAERDHLGVRTAA
jgi:UDP:flavonoid glycosyltransferase YjiC (YdhE family)